MLQLIMWKLSDAEAQDSQEKYVLIVINIICLQVV